jgi:hypothetical protein
LALLAVLAGCAPVRSPSMPPQGASHAAQQKRWVLIENHRRLSGENEPDYVWVEEDAIPGTLNTLLFDKRSIIAPPEVAARHAPPPDGGGISHLQGGLHGTVGQAIPRGYVVHVDDKRVVIDLAAKEGLVPGMVVSIRRDGTPLAHPVTGQPLGTLEDEIAMVLIIEVHENFSVGLIESTRPGVRIRIQDRAVPEI